MIWFYWETKLHMDSDVVNILIQSEFVVGVIKKKGQLSPEIRKSGHIWQIFDHRK